jgi:hypothetical protein
MQLVRHYLRLQISEIALEPFEIEQSKSRPFLEAGNETGALSGERCNDEGEGQCRGLTFTKPPYLASECMLVFQEILTWPYFIRKSLRAYF